MESVLPSLAASELQALGLLLGLDADALGRAGLDERRALVVAGMRDLARRRNPLLDEHCQPATCYRTLIDAVASALEIPDTAGLPVWRVERAIIDHTYERLTSRLDPSARHVIEERWRSVCAGAPGAPSDHDRQRARLVFRAGIVLALLGDREFAAFSDADWAAWTGLSLALGPLGALLGALWYADQPSGTALLAIPVFFGGHRAKNDLVYQASGATAAPPNPFAARWRSWREHRRRDQEALEPALGGEPPQTGPPLRRGVKNLGVSICQIGLPLATLAVLILRWARPLDLDARVIEALRVAGAVLLSACVGFFTNWAAIKMLFHPRRRFWCFQGLIPKRKPALAGELAAIIEQRLINAESIRHELIEGRILEKLRGWVLEKLDDLVQDPDFHRDLSEWLYHKLVEWTPKIAAFIDQAVDEYVARQSWWRRQGLKLARWWADLDAERSAQAIRDELADRPRFEALIGTLIALVRKLPEQLDEHEQAQRFERAVLDALQFFLDEIPIRAIIERQVRLQDEAELEAMIDDAGGRELAVIQILGAVFGAVAGLLFLVL